MLKEEQQGPPEQEQQAPAALVVEGLTKRYDDGTLALDELDLTIPDGAFFGLLGPNGAGKTTLINSVTGLVRVTGGSIRVFGHEAIGDGLESLAARAIVGLAPQDVILDEPTAGVDFELRLELWRYIRRLHERGTTILLTTHYLEEAEMLCEEIALIRGGRVIARDTAAGLKERFDAATLEDVYMKTVAAGRRAMEEEV